VPSASLSERARCAEHTVSTSEAAYDRFQGHHITILTTIDMVVRRFHKITESDYSASPCLSVRMVQIASHWTHVREILHSSIFRKYVEVKFYILVTVHFGIIPINYQLDAQLLLYMFISILYMFRATLCSSSGESIVLSGSRPAYRTVTYIE
jgi:hypothetical protein